ncbi:MAG: hypothetical protein JWP31_152, partial [Aeromicrobium sp.]|nr:hypothetical protein [Aeromicrobium sp.]
VSKAQLVLDTLLAGGAKMRLWTVAPSYAGTGGTEVTDGGYSAPTVTFNAAVAGSGGQIAKATSSSSAPFTNMPVASTSVAAFSLHDPSDNSLIVVVSSWTSPTAWAIGDSPNIAAGNLVVPIVPA